MQKHRLIVNTTTGSITPDATEAVEIEARLYHRQTDGTLRPLDAYAAGGVGEYVSSGWHDCPKEALAAAAEELGKRIEVLAGIRAACLAKSEVVNV